MIHATINFHLEVSDELHVKPSTTCVYVRSIISARKKSLAIRICLDPNDHELIRQHTTPHKHC